MVQQLTGVLASRIEVSPIYGNLMVVFLCAPGWIRTSDLLINSQMLCLLSYKGIFFKKRAISDRTLHIVLYPLSYSRILCFTWRERRDSNPRPLD